MNRTICNIKYDIMSLSDKIDGLINTSEKTGYGEILTDEDTFQKEIFQILPIENEEDLSLFESKLSNQEFRKKVTLELKRYAKDSLPSTVRAVMRFLFKDKLLNIFSYKGQKGKKVFYTLTICSVIFDSIKLMKKFHKFDTIDVEGPLKIFISGAKFRDVPKTKTNQSMKD
ncbi:unnamed protein product [Macrosiphum euphorbiae]|uniref:DUF4806 domain-containing protein n=1 Tax=Macrosiphum euphorbiae TaxID=13131 RepID=A0AAV0WDE8_9HEMI|nr:unnamed protein product [Macrosiphum euphorbiae]